MFTLDFTTATLDPRITFTRALNTATRVNSSGLIEVVNADLPRFDYDPVSLRCLGLLVEGTSQNICLQSQNFATTWANTSSSEIVDVEVSPSGVQDADKVYSANGVDGYISQNINLTSGVSYTASVFANAAGFNFFRIYLSAAGGDKQASYTLSDDGSTSSVTSGATASIKRFEDGWYRCSITFTAVSTGAAGLRIYPQRFTTGNANQDGIFLWGAQVEPGDLTSYIPTTTTALTRNADVATITGSNFSDFWQATHGGALVFATPSTVSGIRTLVQFDDNTVNEIIALRGNTTNPELYIVDGGTPQSQIDAGTIAANTAYALTGWWATNDCKARKDAGAVVTDTAATIPTVTQMRIGSDGTNYLNGTIATIGYYDSFFGRPIYTRRKNKVFPSLL